MGFFNSMRTVGEINRLLKDFENIVTIAQSQVQDNADKLTLINSLNVMKNIHQQLINQFSNSAGARIATYTIFGDKMQMDALLNYTKKVCYNLYGIIQNK